MRVLVLLLILGFIVVLIITRPTEIKLSPYSIPSDRNLMKLEVK